MKILLSRFYFYATQGSEFDGKAKVHPSFNNDLVYNETQAILEHFDSIETRSKISLYVQVVVVVVVVVIIGKLSDAYFFFLSRIRFYYMYWVWGSLPLGSLGTPPILLPAGLLLLVAT